MGWGKFPSLPANTGGKFVGSLERISLVPASQLGAVVVCAAEPERKTFVTRLEVVRFVTMPSNEEASIRWLILRGLSMVVSALKLTMTIIAPPAPSLADNHCDAATNAAPLMSRMARRLRHCALSKLYRAPIHSAYGARRIHASAQGEFSRASAAVSRRRTDHDLTSSGPMRMSLSSVVPVSRITHQTTAATSRVQMMKNADHHQRCEGVTVDDIVAA